MAAKQLLYLLEIWIALSLSPNPDQAVTVGFGNPTGAMWGNYLIAIPKGFDSLKHRK